MRRSELSNVLNRPSPGHRSSVVDTIYDWMLRAPRAIALTDGDLEWTYDDLRRRSDAVARSLSSRGIARGSVIGMHLPRCADAIAVMLGVMISGCVYLPLDPSYPAPRVRYMLDRAGAAAVISDAGDPDLYGSHRIWLPSPSRLTAEPEPPAFYDAERVPLGPHDRAYVLFTSGSTGKPKGVVVTHENITLLIEWSAKFLGAAHGDASATSSSLSFDPSFYEILLPLSVGGTVHVIPDALALGNLDRPVSFVATTPTVASELLRAGLLPSLKALMVGGEALAPDVAARLLSSGRVERLLNAYGPTECTVFVTVEDVTAPVPEVIPIGRPVAGAEVLILDGGGRRLPDGETGEICIFGGQVADGYVNDPAGTAERFVADSHPTAGLGRYYRTGDLGYRAADGEIYFGGRADRQVKINGIRIELAEIDAALRSYPQVSEAATIVRDDGRAVAYVVPARAGGNVDIAGLRTHLTGNLPRFMRPAGIVVLAELPRTVNGKLDASALPEWSPGRPGRDLPGASNLDELTARVIGIVAEVTGFAGQIQPADDFIDDLGGTSLGIVRVLVELERYSGRRIRISDALADTSVAGLVRLLGEDAATPIADFAFNPNGDAPPLFMIHAYLGSMLGLRRLAALLPPNQPVYGLQVYSGIDQAADRLTIPAMAENALKRMREIQPAGPITMLGQSAGGLIVFEAARSILEAGGLEPRVLLLDIPRPSGAFGYYWGEVMMHWREIIRHPSGIIRGGVAMLFQLFRPEEGRSQAAPESDDLMTLNERNLRSIADAVKAHRARPYDGSITVMRTRQGRVMALGRRCHGWAPVTMGTLRTIDVPGGHLNMLEAPNLTTVTEKLIGWLSGGHELAG